MKIINYTNQMAQNLKRTILLSCLLFFIFFNMNAQEDGQVYGANIPSLSKHETPEWYKNAKLGIFIHWGLYSVPAWAPTKVQFSDSHGDDIWKNFPYAEWYLNTMKIEGSPTQKHHNEVYGENFDYYDFSKTFNEEVLKWDPKEMAGLFKKVHARYVVLTTKHHDGFTLWPSQISNPHLPYTKQKASRDIVGELTNAIRENDMRMGLYYSGGYDWPFKHLVVENDRTHDETIPQTQEYADYADEQYFELIHKYKPAVLWNDMFYPHLGKKHEIFAEYYNLVPDGVINNRWNDDIHDFTTPEYANYDVITPKKWETSRGIDLSYGYNQNSTEDQMLSVEELIYLFVDIVSKNGNLLLNVGPKPDGSIPNLQKERLLGLGKWLDTNGEAIFDTEPWIVAESKTQQETPIRFTYKNGKVYAILLGVPKGKKITIPNLVADDSADLIILGIDNKIKWENKEEGLTITLPSTLKKDNIAYTIVFDKQPIIQVKK